MRLCFDSQIQEYLSDLMFLFLCNIYDHNKLKTSHSTITLKYFSNQPYINQVRVHQISFFGENSVSQDAFKF